MVTSSLLSLALRVRRAGAIVIEPDANVVNHSVCFFPPSRLSFGDCSNERLGSGYWLLQQAVPGLFIPSLFWLGC